ncbi:ABC transporter permease [Flavisolibacter nicotianae]|uniref:ABC transporter permease n=1 Tax=Flavisolibacter nicotianae TaxID=2364882 RepID=UPI000EB47AB4|nr:ABC transporter permease [Flavisolibacter nicotianae]
MLKNYFRVALRSLLKRKGYSLINILGLATGMAVCLLIVLFVKSELGYDRHNEKGDSIYRVVFDRIYPGRSTSYSMIPQSIGPAIQKEFPEVQEVTRVFNFTGGIGNFFMRVGDKTFEEKKVLAVDSNFFRVFTGTFLVGNPATALQQQNAVVLSESAAKKIYGSADAAMGKQFQTDGDGNNTFLVTGVCKDWPGNSHFTFDLLLSVSGFPFIRQPNHTGFAAHTYLLLSPHANPKALESKLPLVVEKYVSGAIEQAFNQSYQDFKKAGNGYHYYLQPLQKIHLISDLEAELSPNGSLASVYIFGVIAVFILFLACINFINLSTARSVERAKEVGIRKTFGSEKNALIIQFLVESVVLALFALLLAIGLMFILLPLFNQVSGKNLTHSYLVQPLFLLVLVVFAILVGVVAGLYPAFVLSSFQPIEVLKGRFKSNKKGLVLRNGLVVFQFAISVILIIAAIVVNQQMRYMLGDRLGFRKDHIIIIERADLLDRRTESFKTELLKIPGVEMITGTSAMPGTQNFFGTSWQKENAKETLTGRGLVVDENFAKTLGLALKEGRFFSKEFGTDSLSVVLNEKAVQELGLGANPVGARLTTPDGFFNAPDGKPYVYTVAGVLNDFHFQSLHQKISPLVITNSARGNGANNLMAVRVKADNFKAAVEDIENKWREFVKDRPFHYNFFDQTLADQYLAEQTTQKIFTVFSSLAIFIACIGLLGLVAYTTQQRTREISIRKVLGATASNIVNMLSKDFLKLVLVTSLIGLPVAWLGMHKWLQDFAYRVNISWWVFVMAAVVAVVIALLTISFQSLKAAFSNPVKNLRSE